MLYPREYVEAPDYSFTTRNDAFRLFLAGGITGCPDWQSYVVKQLMFSKSLAPVILLNPRRKNFPMDKPEEAKEQIRWEFEALNAANMILFWFPEETLCPITLFELGRHSIERKTHLVVGCHPGYQRRQDVEIQMKLVRPGLEVMTNLRDLVSETSIKLGDITSSPV